MAAYRYKESIYIGRPPANATATTETLALPCGKCTGCRSDKARAWTLRCHLEMQQHRSATFVTLTYDDDHLPPTLSREHLQKWVKRFRKETTKVDPTRRIRFFACGEYGEHTNRAHYHAIIFGGQETDRPLVAKAWSLNNRPFGRTQCDRATPHAIAYVAGYVAKKYNYIGDEVANERVDPTTGEVYTHQPPFLQMSQGIGGEARKHTDSWRSFAVYNGGKLAVPRYLHEAWRATATEHEKQLLREEKRQIPRPTYEQLKALEQIVEKRRELQNDRRRKI